jgi:hypothetical protein
MGGHTSSLRETTLIDLRTYTVFIVAALAVIAAPGPDIFYVLSASCRTRAGEPGDSADVFTEAERDLGSCDVAFYQGDVKAMAECFESGNRFLYSA